LPRIDSAKTNDMVVSCARRSVINHYRIIIFRLPVITLGFSKIVHRIYSLHIS
jgi:hypothetical protein